MHLPSNLERTGRHVTLIWSAGRLIQKIVTITVPYAVVPHEAYLPPWIPGVTMNIESHMARALVSGLCGAGLLVVNRTLDAQITDAQSMPQSTQAGSASSDERQLSTSQAQSARHTVSFDMLPTPIASKYVDQQSGYRVEDLVRLATERNRDLLAARQNVVITQGRLVQAGLRPNPSINYDHTTDRGLGGEGEGGFGISYLHPIELGGKRDKRVDVARLELEQAQAELGFRERQLQVDTQSQFAEALAAVESLRAVERLRELDENMLRLTEARLAEGDVPKLDVNLVRVELNRLRAQQFQFENRLQASLLSLRTLVGLDMDQGLRLRGDLQAQAIELTAGAAERLAMENRQDLKAAKLAEEVAAADIRLASAQAVPDITLFVGYRRERSVFGAESLRQVNPSGVASGASLSDTDKLLNFGASVQLPFFNRNQGAKQEAGGRLAQARRAREFVEMVVRRDVEIALNRYQAARAAVGLFQTQILTNGRDNLQIVNALYMAGQQPIFEVIGEQRRYMDSQNLYVDALKEYYLSLVELERAIGRPLPGNRLSS